MPLVSLNKGQILDQLFDLNYIYSNLYQVKVDNVTFDRQII